MFNELREEVMVHFIDIDGFVERLCLKFLFINTVGCEIKNKIQSMLK